MLYEPALRRFLSRVSQDGSIPSPTMWLNLYARISDEDRGAGLVRGRYAEFLKDCPHEVIAWVVDIYEEAIVHHRYCNIDDILAGSELPTCPVTNLGIKPLDLSLSTIDALEGIWERYVGTPYERRDLVPLFVPMMTRLLRITLHMQWAGFAGFATFDRKWSQLKSWRRGDYTDPLVAEIMEYLITPPSWFNDLVPRIAPLDLRKRLYKELFDLYTTNTLDPAIWEESDKTDGLLSLSRTVQADEGLDDLFKVPYRRHAGVQDDGNEVGKTGDS